MPAERPDSYAVPAPVRAAAAWSWRLLLIGVAAAAGVWLLTRLAQILIPVAVALLLSTLLGPLRNRLMRWVPKGVAVAISLVGLIVFAVLLIYLATRQLYSGFNNLWGQALSGIQEVQTWLTTGPLHLDAAQINSVWADIQNFFTGQGGINTIFTGALGAVTTAGNVVAGAAIALFCTAYFLSDGKTIWAWIVNLFPRSARERIHQASRRGLFTLQGYVKTQIIVAFIDSVGIALGSLFFVPHLSLPIGFLVFLGSFIPVVGAIISGFVATIVVLVSRGFVSALIMLAIVLAVQQIESTFLLPILMGHAVQLHPVAVVLAVAGGSMLAGIPGALFAVPLVAVANTFVLYLFGHDKFPELGLTDHVPTLRKRPTFDQLSLTALTGTIRRPRKQHDDSGENRGWGARIQAWREARDPGAGEEAVVLEPRVGIHEWNGGNRVEELGDDIVAIGTTSEPDPYVSVGRVDVR